jgi:hypothetical protein
MNIFQGTRTHRAAATIATVAVLAAGLMTATVSMAGPAFDARMSSTIAHVKGDPGYKTIPLNSSADREWFFHESQSLYEKKISKEQYVADGSKQFPGYEASFAELADLLTAP